MNNISQIIANDLQVPTWKVDKVLELLTDGNTVPFIARYRKEVTGSLDEEQINEISLTFVSQSNLAKRKIEVKKLISERAVLTKELDKLIDLAYKLSDVEAIYLPYKEKKKTRASIAVANGLQDLAIAITSNKDISLIINDFITDDLAYDDCLRGAQDIIAEEFSQRVDFRQRLENLVWKYGIISSKKKSKVVDNLYTNFHDFRQQIKQIPPHRYMALNRAHSEGVISRSIEVDYKHMLMIESEKLLGKCFSEVERVIINQAINDSMKRLIWPSIERKIYGDMFDKAQNLSIKTFQVNLEQLIMQKPLQNATILAIDPAFRTGCKIAVVDPNSNVLHIDVIYPHQPKNQIQQSKIKINQLCKQFNVNFIAVGNGTASRETERLVVETISEYKLTIPYIIVNESGASVYSASKVAIQEFPNLQVEQRSAVSLARRIQDPLAEYVKIDPKAIGVGQYQHDVNQSQLSSSLDFTIEKVVNRVGVNLNTASASLLQHVSGLNATVANNIVAFRENGTIFTTREQLLKVPRLGAKAYEQSVGFLRILTSKNVYDKTGIHPESYDVADQIIQYLNIDKTDIGTEKFSEKLLNKSFDEIAIDLGFSSQLITDIIENLREPLRDVRDSVNGPVLKSDIVEFSNLYVGMNLQGSVMNLTDFGAFVDIGLKQSGLIHISNLSNTFVKHPSDVLSVGDIVDVEIISLDEVTKKVGLKRNV